MFISTSVVSTFITTLTVGFIIGDKIFVDFTKYSYKEALKRLKSQLNLLIKSKEISEVVKTKIAEKEINSKRKQIEAQSKTEVEHWFKINSTFIFEQLLPCTGDLLNQLHAILDSNPDFFFKNLCQNDLNIKNSKIIAELSGKLKNLFN